VLAELVGVKNTVGPTMAQLGTNFGMQEIPGKALAVISDARLGKSDPRMAVERLLAASGEDRITIDRKYREPWTGTLSARFIVLANEPPVFQDASGAIVTRFVILTTRNTFLGKEDRALTEKLKAELTGILNWSLEGLRRLDEGSGKFAQPESAAEVIQGMREVVSPVGAFLEERCQRGGSEAKETLYAAWLAWCKESRNHPGSIQQFSIDLRAAWPEVRDARPRNGGKRQRRWTGVSLRRE
jgi:putative DNA primase/helicase